MKYRTVLVVVMALVAAVVATLGPGVAPVDAQPADGGRQIVSVTGQSTARPDLQVDVILAVPAGRSVEGAAADALRAQGARPVQPAALGSDGFTTTGVVWPGAVVTQFYNPDREPLPTGSLLGQVQATWSGVTTSDFWVTDGGTTDRCGSLVKECPGPQVTDGYNDVGWQRLRGSSNTLGVAWSVSSGANPEVDVALNLAAGPWDAQLTEAVLLHEEGHFAGLGHSEDAGSVMYAYIGDSPRTSLTADDEEGLTYLYPSRRVDVTGTVTNGTTAVAGATVQLVGTSFTATTGGDGTYTLTDVPAPVTYDVRASADGVAETERVTISDGNGPDFVLSSATDEGGGGGPNHCADPRNANHPSCRNR